MTRRDYEDLALSFARARYIATKKELPGVELAERMLVTHIKDNNKAFDEGLFNTKVMEYLEALDD